MAAVDMIDLASMSSDEETCQSPELLSPIIRQRLNSNNNRKRGYSNNNNGEEVLSVSSSPSLSPGARTMVKKSSEEKKRESLDRARQWSDERKRSRAFDQVRSRSTAAAAAASNRNNAVVNLSSPTSPAREARSGGVVDDSPLSTPRKMSPREKKAARERARQWHENRDGGRRLGNNNTNDEEEREEVVNLSSPSSDLPSSSVGHNQRSSTYEAVGRQRGRRRGRGSSTQQPRSLNAATSAVASARGSGIRNNQQQQQQWSCPRCTLLNNQHSSRCSACDHGNPSRPQQQQQRQRNNRGRSNAPGGNGERESISNMSYERLLEVFGDGSDNYASSLSGDGWGRSRTSNPFVGGSGVGAAGFGYAYRNNPMLAQMLLQSHAPRNPYQLQHQGGGGARESIENMSYERLLEVFGDGSENRGASSTVIASLPVTKIRNPESELPEDKRQCSICLEDFSKGDERTSLPCLHGFHTACVNRWLTSNGTCPVCKTSVSGNGGS